MKNGQSNTKTHDNGAKLIFDDPILCAQFLRGYTNIEILKDVQPEDIEDISERFLPVVYYEGTSRWTEARNFKERVYLNEVLKQYIPDFEYLLELISKIIAVFLYRLNVPRNEVEQFTDQIKGGEFQMLFDSFEAYDVQETRRVSKEEGKA